MSIRPSGRAVKLSMKGLLVLLLAGCQFDGRQMVAAMSDAMRQDDDLNETISESSADEGATGVEGAADGDALHVDDEDAVHALVRADPLQRFLNLRHGGQ